MAGKGAAVRWGVEQRLEFIEFRLFWEDGLNRSDLVNFFGISVPQASNDLRNYQQMAPGNIRYDTRVKRYFASERFSPCFIDLDATQYLTQLNSIAREAIREDETWIASLPPFSAVAVPRRSVDPFHLRKVLAAIRNGRALEIRYQSFSDPDPQWRVITPHAFGFDGMRWHTRAYCHKKRVYRDFLLPRMLEVRTLSNDELAGAEDRLWNNEIEVILRPHPECSEGQKKAIELDFGMRKGEVRVGMRHAMLFYFLKRQGFLDDGKTVIDGHEKPARQQHVVLADVKSVQSQLDQTKQ